MLQGFPSARFIYRTSFYKKPLFELVCAFNLVLDYLLHHVRVCPFTLMCAISQYQIAFSEFYISERNVNIK
jgi:hypothetical protein